MAMLKAFPGGIFLRDETWSLPLHCAAVSEKYLDVVKNLIQMYPEAAAEVDANGMVPAQRVGVADSLVSKALRRARGMPPVGSIRNEDFDKVILASCKPGLICRVAVGRSSFRRRWHMPPPPPPPPRARCLSRAT